MSEYLLKNALNLRISTKRFQIDVKSWHSHLDRRKYIWIRCNLRVVWSIAHVVEHVLPVFTREDVYSHRVSSTDCLARLNYLHLLDLHRVKKLININLTLFISFRILSTSIVLLTGQGRYICQSAKQINILETWLFDFAWGQNRSKKGWREFYFLMYCSDFWPCVFLMYPLFCLMNKGEKQTLSVRK